MVGAAEAVSTVSGVGFSFRRSPAVNAIREQITDGAIGAVRHFNGHYWCDYAQNPAALQLRAMNIIYETTKERGSTILIPSAMVDAMNPGGVLGLAAVANNTRAPDAATPNALQAPRPTSG